MQSTSILEAMYLFRAMSKGEIPFIEGFENLTEWAKNVIAEHETGQRDTALSGTLKQPVVEAQDECQTHQSE